MHVPPANTRASGRARAVSFFQNCNFPYVINWDSIACDSRDFLVMGDVIVAAQENAVATTVPDIPLELYFEKLR